MTGKVVVNRVMPVDGFVAAPADSMDWVFDFTSPGQVPDGMAGAGPVLLGHGTPPVTGGLDRVSLAPASSTPAGAATAMRFRTVDRCAG